MPHTNAELHEVVVDGTTTGLDDEDIFSTDRVLDFAARLAYREFAQSAIANWEAKDVANILCQGWVGVPAEDDDIANHGDETSGFLKHGLKAGKQVVNRRQRRRQQQQPNGMI